MTIVHGLRRSVLTGRRRCRREAYRGAEPHAKGSPKGRSPVPGAAQGASKVAANLTGHVQPRQGQSDGAAPASKIVEAWGLTSAIAGASRPMPSLKRSPSSKTKKSNVCT